MKAFRARITTVHQREFPSRPNPSHAGVVNTAVATMARVKGTAHPCECGALWDERATRLFECIDIDVPRDLHFAAQAFIGEGAGFRVSEVRGLWRCGTHVALREVCSCAPCSLRERRCPCAPRST